MFEKDFETIKNLAVKEDAENKDLMLKLLMKRIRKAETLVDKIYFGFIAIKRDYEPLINLVEQPADEGTADDNSEDGTEESGGEEGEAPEASAEAEKKRFSIKDIPYYEQTLSAIKLSFHVLYLVMQPVLFALFYLFESMRKSKDEIITKRANKANLHEFIERMSKAFDDYFTFRRDFNWKEEINNFQMFYKKDYTFMEFSDRLRDYIRKRYPEANHPYAGNSKDELNETLVELKQMFNEHYWYFNDANKKLKDYRLMIFLRNYLRNNLLLMLNIKRCQRILDRRYESCRKISMKYYNIINKKLD